jgi:TPR repeat protein
MSYLLAAAADDDQRAVVLLKRIEKGVRSEQKDAAQVVADVRRKAKAGQPDAQYTLGFMYLIGDGVPKNGAEEVRWYRAAAGRSARAAFMLSIMYQYGEGVPKSSAEAFRLMRIAAEQGDARAQYYVGTYCYQGIGTAVNRKNAGTWFKSSAEKGFADAQLAYSMLLLSGDGVPQDKGQAVEWLGKASSQGNPKARELLRELLTYRGQPSGLALSDTGQPVVTDKRGGEGQVRLEGQGVLLDQGTFGLKFSLPTLYDAYAPQGQTPARPLWEKFQGGTFDIIFRSSP